MTDQETVERARRRSAFWRGWCLGLAVVAVLELGEGAVWLAAGSMPWRPLAFALAAGLGAVAACRAGAEPPPATSGSGERTARAEPRKGAPAQPPPATSGSGQRTATKPTAS